MGDKKQAVLVTTEHRGVFFGYLEEHDRDRKIVKLREARNCLYWSADVKGFLGLAVSGPSDGCRVGLAAPSIELAGVTCVAHVTPEAQERWEKGPWS